MNLKDKKEKNIWETAFISFLLEQKNNKDFNTYTYEEIEKDTKLDITLKKSFQLSFYGILLLLFFISLLKIFLLLFRPILEDDVIKVIMNVAFFILLLICIHVVVLNKVFTKEAIKVLVNYCNDYKIHKNVVVFLVEQHLFEMQDKSFILFNLKQYKLNREIPKTEEINLKQIIPTIENTRSDMKENNGIFQSIKSLICGKDEEENQYDYLKAINFKLDYQEYLEQQENKKR